MRFIMAYSGGKDCTLALDHMLQEGHELAGLFVSCTKSSYSFKHGIRRTLLEQYAKAFGGVPLLESQADMCRDMDEPEEILKRAVQELEAEAVCTGDIYQEAVYAWNLELAEKAGTRLICPLWQRNTLECITEFLDRGYTSLIKTVKTDILPADLLGKPLDADMIRLFDEYGIDPCGENGEYHTITVDGPVFNCPLSFTTGRIVSSKGFAMLDIKAV